MIEAANPRKESGPYSRKISSRKPVAAEVEKSRTKTRGTKREGRKIIFSRGRKTFSRKSSIPEARRADTAVINPIKVGAILITVRNPRSVPEVKRSNTGNFLIKPERIMRKTAKGMIKLERKRIIFMTLASFL